ncbi:MAG: acetyl-CoA carboxylase, carboxyltransferase subunit beta [Eubacterium sp.]|jgi:acetyl-CoA carboxylase carboxyl transferase subunit beta|nr:acetyl-CoA carboxylase, carboxyltransferase subunit beta [Eubacterium sp.]
MLEDLLKTVKDRFLDAAHIGETQISEKKGVPDDIFFKCPRCRTETLIEEFENNIKICPECNYHARLTWRERLDYTADYGTFVEFNKNMTSQNPIGYPDYEEKLNSLSEKYEINDGVITGTCFIRGYRAVLGIMDSHFMMASMGSVAGEKITRAFEYAGKHKLPVVMFTASGGARMQEGIISLMQMAKTSGAVAKFSQTGGLYITVLTDPTTGGVTASFASLGDIIIAEPKVLVGFAGRRVIQDTIRQQLPDDFQSSEYLLMNGFIDMISDRKKMRINLSRIMKLHNYKKEGEI